VVKKPWLNPGVKVFQHCDDDDDDDDDDDRLSLMTRQQERPTHSSASRLQREQSINQSINHYIFILPTK
jgi:hypothetical protein